MMVIYGRKFTSALPVEMIPIAKNEWAESCVGLSEFQITQGFKKAKLLADWDPSIPEFMRFALNLPSIQQATMRVKKVNIIDPVTRNLVGIIGRYDLKTKNPKEIEKMIIGCYEDAYLDAVKEVTGFTENWKSPVQLTQETAVKEETFTKEVGENAVNDAIKGVVTSLAADKLNKSVVKEPEYNEEELIKEIKDHQEKVKANG